MPRPRHVVLAVLCLTLLAAPVLAHVPAFAAGNASPATAHRIPDADKSWSVYDRLEGDRVTYYEFELQAGDRLVAGLFTPGDGPFTPSLVVMGPGIEGSGDVPDRVEVPDGMGARVIDGEKAADPEYEPFTPAATYRTVSVDRRVEEGGRYLLAVYEPDRRAGSVGVVVGYQERFTLVQYLSVPVDLIRVYLWEGDGPLLALGPALATLVGGLALLYRRRAGSETEWDRPRFRYGLAAAGIGMVGTSVTMAVQMVLALVETGLTAGAAVTLAFVVIPVGLAAWLLRAVCRAEFELGRRTRAGLLVVGVGGLLTWSGLIVAPLAVVLAAFFPAERGA